MVIEKIDCEYHDYFDEENKEEHVFIICPKCQQDEEISWSELEPGSNIFCDNCGFEWEVADCTMRGDDWKYIARLE